MTMEQVKTLFVLLHLCVRSLGCLSSGCAPPYPMIVMHRPTSLSLMPASSCPLILLRVGPSQGILTSLPAAALGASQITQHHPSPPKHFTILPSIITAHRSDLQS